MSADGGPPAARNRRPGTVRRRDGRRRSRGRRSADWPSRKPSRVNCEIAISRAARSSAAALQPASAASTLPRRTASSPATRRARRTRSAAGARCRWVTITRRARSHDGRATQRRRDEPRGAAAGSAHASASEPSSDDAGSCSASTVTSSKRVGHETREPGNAVASRRGSASARRRAQTRYVEVRVEARHRAARSRPTSTDRARTLRARSPMRSRSEPDRPASARSAAAIAGAVCSTQNPQPCVSISLHGQVRVTIDRHAAASDSTTDEPEALGVGALHHDVGVLQQRPFVAAVNRADRVDVPTAARTAAAADRESGRARPARRARGASTDALARSVGKRVGEQIEPLDAVHAAEEQHDERARPGCRAARDSRATRCARPIEIDAVGHDRDRHAQARDARSASASCSEVACSSAARFTIAASSSDQAAALRQPAALHRLRLQHASRRDDVRHVADCARQMRRPPLRHVPDAVDVTDVGASAAPRVSGLRTRAPKNRRGNALRRRSAPARRRTRSPSGGDGGRLSCPLAVVVTTSTSTPARCSPWHRPRTDAGGPPYGDAGGKVGRDVENPQRVRSDGARPASNSELGPAGCGLLGRSTGSAGSGRAARSARRDRP